MPLCPAADGPDVSLVMVVYGKFDLASQTLTSLKKSLERSPLGVEVVVVDNASPDSAGQRIASAHPDVRVHLSPANLGFGTGANLGVLEAAADVVGILNSDLQFEEGWLDTLYDTMRSSRRIGAVVPLYVHPDGRVLDAGQLVGADGRGYAYANGRSPHDADVGFVRAVDYGSAAAMIVRRDAFDIVGGFDPIYGLGYYEDLDLGFSLRRAGFESVIDPRARVVHLRGGSFDRRLRQRLVAANRDVVLERFQPELRGRPLLRRPPYDPHRELIVRDWWAARRLLLVDNTGDLAGLAAAIQERWRWNRVTWLGVGPGAPGTDPWVEWVPVGGDAEAWLRGRRFHYSSVITSGALEPRLVHAIERTQPQARFGSGDVPDRAGLDRAMRGLAFGVPDPS